MARSIREMLSEMGDNHGNFELFRLDSSVRRKTRICAEIIIIITIFIQLFGLQLDLLYFAVDPTIL